MSGGSDFQRSEGSTSYWGENSGGIQLGDSGYSAPALLLGLYWGYIWVILGYTGVIFGLDCGPISSFGTS